MLIGHIELRPTNTPCMMQDGYVRIGNTFFHCSIPYPIGKHDVTMVVSYVPTIHQQLTMKGWMISGQERNGFCWVPIP